MKSNDQDPIQSNSTSCPRLQTGNEHKQFRPYIKQNEDVNTSPTDCHQAILDKTNKRSVEDKQEADEQWQLE